MSDEIDEDAFAKRLEREKVKLSESFNEEKEKLRAELEQEREAMRTELENERNQLKQQFVKPEKVYTEAELERMVDDAELTQAEANKIFKEQIKDELMQEVRGELKNQQTSTTVSSEITEYKRLKPDITRESEDRRKVANEYAYLVSIGMPSSISTELAALRNVFGPVDKLKQPQKEYETHQETPGGEETEPEHSVVKKMDKRTKSYYEKRIENGIYKDWDEVEAELKYKRG